MNSSNVWFTFHSSSYATFLSTHNNSSAFSIILMEAQKPLTTGHSSIFMVPKHQSTDCLILSSMSWPKKNIFSVNFDNCYFSVKHFTNLSSCSNLKHEATRYCLFLWSLVLILGVDSWIFSFVHSCYKKKIPGKRTIRMHILQFHEFLTRSPQIWSIFSWYCILLKDSISRVLLQRFDQLLYVL